MTNGQGGQGKPPATNRGVIETFQGRAFVTVDWFSGFVETDNVMNAWPDQSLLAYALETQYGADMKPANRQGFSGHKQGSVFWGMRHDGSFRELSGAAAERYTDPAGAVSRLIRCSRLDIAYTFETEEYDAGIARQYYEMGPQNTTGRGAARGRTMYEQHNGGSTLYIGSTASERRIRLYDKYAERKFEREYRNLWRYELQLRGATARATWLLIRDSQNSRETMGAILQNECYRENLLLAHRISDNAHSLPIIERTDSNAASKLSWLETQVAPTVRSLKALGYEDEVREIFGLRNQSG